MVLKNSRKVSVKDSVLEGFSAEGFLGGGFSGGGGFMDLNLGLRVVRMKREAAVAGGWVP